MKNITLRIKKKYFDQILFGTKWVEYRDVKPFYDRMFRNKEEISTLTLHYQQGRKLRCKIIEIKKLTFKEAKRLTPHEFTDDDITFGKYVYAIFVKSAKLI